MFSMKLGKKSYGVLWLFGWGIVRIKYISRCLPPHKNDRVDRRTPSLSIESLLANKKKKKKKRNGYLHAFLLLEK